MELYKLLLRMAERGCVDMVKILMVDMGVDYKKYDKKGDLIVAACKSNNITQLYFILDDMNYPRDMTLYALSMLCHYSCTNTTCALIEKIGDAAIQHECAEIACIYGNICMVNYLIYLNPALKSSASLLKKAIEGGRYEVIKQLLEHKCYIDPKVDYGIINTLCTVYEERAIANLLERNNFVVKGYFNNTTKYTWCHSS